MYDIIFEHNPIVIRSYALMLTIAFIAGTILAAMRARKYGITSQEVANLVIVIITASIVGSRMLYVLEHPETFSVNPIRILLVTQGGLSYHGGLVLAIAGTFFWAKRRSIPIGMMADVLAPSVALGLFFVRIGCFLNGCCFGTPTNIPWGVVFPPDSPAGRVYENAIHPTQLYSSLSGLVLFIFLLVFERKVRFPASKGFLFFIFLILSTIGRLIMEIFRYHESYATFERSLPIHQIFFTMFLLAISIIALRTYKKG